MFSHWDVYDCAICTKRRVRVMSLLLAFRRSKKTRLMTKKEEIAPAICSANKMI